ncbi:ankyrin repeat-containing domain protein [Lyophyllum atratum]|nr:ankyrin repeat-containing domain protein [Lyophyllum atratum]
MAEETKGASNNERLLAAARSDNEDLLLEVFEEKDFDINCQDGLGNTPLHNAVSNGSTDVLEYILSHEDCDVDPQNKLDRSTPLHLAVRIEHMVLRKHIVESLLDAGADTRIKDKNGETVLDILPPNDNEIRGLIIKARAEAGRTGLSRDDIASDDEDGSAGSGSGSE